MTEQKVSFRYARAIIETAIADKVTDKLFNDFKIVEEIVSKSKELKAFLKSPVVPDNKKKGVITELFKDHISIMALNFIVFLVTKSRAELLLDIIAQYEVQYFKFNNKQKVDIISAIELNDDMKAKIISKISSNINMEVIPTFITEADLKGGIMVQIDDWVYDASLKSQLDNLFIQLSRN
jgi:F-type H+-transporting ATPase subunit delta